MGQKSTYAMPQLFSPAESPVWWPVASGASLEERGLFRARLCHDRCWSLVSLDTVTGQTVETDTDLVLELIVLTNTSIT